MPRSAADVLVVPLENVSISSMSDDPDPAASPRFIGITATVDCSPPVTVALLFHDKETAAGFAKSLITAADNVWPTKATEGEDGAHSLGNLPDSQVGGVFID